MLSMIFGPVRFLSRALTDQHAPRQLSLAVALGISLGLVPKANLLAVAITVLIFALRVNLLLAMIVALLSSGLAMTCQVGLDRLGLWLLSTPWAELVIPPLFQKPLFAWTYLDNTLVAGGLLAAICQLPITYVTGYYFFRGFKIDDDVKPFQLLRGIFRREYLLTRGTLLMMSLVLFWLAITPAIKLSVENACSHVAGADVAADHVAVRFGTNQIQLHGVTVSNVDESNVVVARVARVDLDVDRSALWKRQLHITSGEISGLMLQDAMSHEPSAARTEAMVDPSKDSLWGFAGSEGFVDGRGPSSPDWLQESLQSQFVSTAGSARAPALSAELASNWLAEFDQLEQAAQQANGLIEQCIETLDQSNKNPLRDIFRVEEAAAGLEKASQQLTAIEADIERLEQQRLMDRELIEEAQQQDAARLTSVPVPGGVDAHELSEYLWKDEVRERLSEILSWYSRCRTYLPDATRQVVRQSLQRGRLVQSTEMQDIPDVVIEKLDFRGAGVFGGEMVKLKGQITNWTTNPDIQSAPTAVSLVTLGRSPATIRRVMANRATQSLDQLTVDFRSIPSAARSFGESGPLVVHAGPGSTRMVATLKVDGDHLSGEVRLQRSESRILATVPEHEHGTVIEKNLLTALASLNSIDATVRLDGTIDRPTWTLDSNLGDTIASQLRESAGRIAESRERSLIEEMRTEVDRSLAQLEQQAVARRNVLWSQLQLDIENVDQGQQRVAVLLKPLLRRPRRQQSGADAVRR